MRSTLIVFKPQLTDYLFLTTWPWPVLLPSNTRFGTANSRTYRDCKILRNLFSTFAVLWLAKQAVYVRYKMYRTYGGLVLPKRMLCKSKWQTNHCVWFCSRPSSNIQWCNVLCYPFHDFQQPETHSSPIWRILQLRIRSLDNNLNCWPSFWSWVSRTFVCFRLCWTSELSTWLV